MSGGYFEHADVRLKTEMFGFDKFSNVLEDRELSELTFDLLDVIHEFDWYMSGDTSENNYIKAKTEFKKKWLSNRGVRVKMIVDEAIDELRQELYKTYGLESEGK